MMEILVFTGSFDVMRWTVFITVFLVVTAGFEKFINWAEMLEG